MNKAALPWSIKGVDFDAREAAKEATRRDGMTLGEWMNGAISDRAAEIGVPAQEFNADERLEAVAAELARLSRGSGGDATPQRRRGETRRSDRQAWRDQPPESAHEDAPPSPASTRGKVFADPEALLEKAVAAFETQASRVEAGAARAFASVATLIEKSENARAGKMTRLDERLAEIETRLREPGPGAAVRPLAREAAPVTSPTAGGAACDEQFLDLERRFGSLIERLDRPHARVSAPASPRRDLDRAISAIEARQRDLDAYPRLARTPPLAALIEQRFEALNRRLDGAPPQGAARPTDDVRETASSSEIEALARQVAAMSRALEDVAPRSQLASLEHALRDLHQNIERSRDDGLREAVLAPIESMARDLRGAVAQAGDAENFDGIAEQLGKVEGKLDELLRTGWADRADFRKVQDKSDELRAAVAAAIDHMAPIERIEQQIAALAGRLEDLAYRSGEASRAQETRLDDLAARIDGAGSEARVAPIPPTLEPLLRALAEKLDLAASPQADARAIAALERQVAQVAAQVSEKSEGEPAWGPRLEQAIADLASRFERARETEHDAARNALREAMAGLPEIVELREEHRTSDLRAQQTLSAVHETLEKVVDRLAMLEDELLEARAGQGDRPPDHAAASGPAQGAFDRDDFLVEPGSGRPVVPPGEAGVENRSFPDDVFGPARTSPQSNYIEVARRALAARAAADQADKAEAEQRKRAGFVRPLATGAKPDVETGVKAKRRLPALLAMAGAVLALGAWQTYRIFDFAPQAPRQTSSQAATEAAPLSTVEPASESRASAAIAPSEDQAAVEAPVDSAPAAQQPSANAAQTPAPQPPAAEPPAPDGTPGAPPPAPKAGGQSIGPGASLVDPLPVGTIKPRANTMSSLQMALLKEMATKGDAAAQFEMGARLLDGRGFPRDPAAAVGWFEKAAAQGLAPAQFRLGGIYEKGAGVPRDAARARDYYEKAAVLGHVRAMHNLAVMLAEGVDGKPDYATAAQWFRRAADYGLRDSQYNLAILYARGLGVGQNFAQSFVWFDLAARQGDEDAATKRDEVAARLDAPTLAAARKQADEFRARTPTPAINDPPAAPTGGAASSVLAPNLAKILGSR